MTDRRVVILADDDFDCRLQPFSELLRASVADIDIVCCQNVPEALRVISEMAEEICLCSVDHDFADWPFDHTGRRLRPTQTGFDVIGRLLELQPLFAVICHTSSAREGNLMAGQLQTAGWSAQYLGRGAESPEEWLRDRWLPAALAALS